MRSYESAMLLALLATACGSSTDSVGTAGSGAGGSGGNRYAEPGTTVVTQLPDTRQQEMSELMAKLDEVRDLSAEQFARAYAVPFSSGPGYDPLTASGLDLLQASALGLDADENAALAANGFVVSERKKFPSFVYGYQSIYAQDLPVYVSADSVLHAFHNSYDTILKSLEYAALSPALDRMLGGMRQELGNGAVQGQAARDADLYLAVAQSLLRGVAEAPVQGADAAEIAALFEGAQAASGFRTVELFGVSRDMDFSQFEPRGHYTESEELKRYFRAMMWLGRIDFRIIETLPDHSQVFRRRQLEAALALDALMNEATRSDWSVLDRSIEAFVGEPDNMTLPELDGLLADLGLSSAAGLASIDDASIAQAIIDGGYGTQRISSHIMINGLGEGTMPLSSTFLLLGQRYVVDSHVFSNVVYDRVQGGSVMRMMPDPLDAGFAALGNDQAGQLLAPELEQYRYAPDLASMRILVDAHPSDFWDANLYNLWLGAIRTLSPSAQVSDPAAAGLPSVAGSEAWGRRLLSAQLASWAELRHDTILYAKQSYTGGASCEYPDAYVDPYPELYAQIAAMARHGGELVAGLEMPGGEWVKTSTVDYFATLEEVASILGEMAQNQRSGAPHTQAHIDFINQAVVVEEGCGDPVGAHGWYSELFYQPIDGVEFDPTIADVHTQPTDEGGSPVGRVLHVGTGMPRLMVVTADTCTGPRAYVGLASSYFERVTENFDRLTDERWSEELLSATPDDPEWLSGIVVR